VAKYSSRYWKNNLSKWDEYYSAMSCGPNSLGKLSPVERSVLQADSKGALAGALAGVASVPGAFATALVGGGMASCIAGVCHGFKITHITDWL
jgi:hypothetical protein